MSRLSDYEVLAVIGTGAFGTCFKVKCKQSKELFVWKAVDYSTFTEANKQNLLDEISLLKQLKHPHIVEYFDHIIHRETSTLYILMECCDGGDLEKLIKRCVAENCHLDEVFIWRVLYQLSKAVQGCHSWKSDIIVLHRDIKPANVFLDSQGNIKLGDFGLARVLSKDAPFAQTVVGTPYYMSPELIKGKKYNRKSDIWALGCLVYELCALKPPFTGSRIDLLSRQIGDGVYDPIPEMYSQDLQKIIAFLLSVDHGYRPTIEIILHHPTVVSNVDGLDGVFPKLIPNEFAPNPDLASTIKSFKCFEIESTPALRQQLLYGSVRRRVFPNKPPNKALSDPGSYKEGKKITSNKSSSNDDPNEVTQNIFNEALKQRLLAIRCRESALKKKEEVLNAKEKHLATRERLFRRQPKMSVPLKSIPEKKSNFHDASYVSIEPNETIQAPTVAKMDPNMFGKIRFQERKVAFRSPIKHTTYNIENVAPQSPVKKTISKNSTKKAFRKTFFSIFHSKNSEKQNTDNNIKENDQNEAKVSACQPVEAVTTIPEVASNKWTAENKRAAFEMLAMMNEAELRPCDRSVDDQVLSNKIIRHDRRRKSIMVLPRSRENILI